MDSRFSISVVREFKYRAKLSDGDIIEADDFKTLFRHARTALRIECGRTDDGHYATATATFSFGWSECHYTKPGYGYGQWHLVNDLGLLYVSTLSEAYTPGDYGDGYSNSRGVDDKYRIMPKLHLSSAYGKTCR